MNVVKDEDMRVPLRNWASTLEQAALEQAKNITRLPFIHPHGVALMPDAHAGIGSTVGSVIATQGAIIPAAVGVDIGCGMVAVRTSLKASQLPDNLRDVRLQIERDIPLGPGGKHRADSFDKLRQSVWAYLDPTSDRNNIDARVRLGLMSAFIDNRRGTKDPLGDLSAKAWEQLGTLGSGNHFIELCVDQSQDVWIMLHSGSRGVGNIIGRHYIERAQKECGMWHSSLPHNDLAFFPEDTPGFNHYVLSMLWAQDFARQNRAVMLQIVIQALRRHLPAFELTEEAVNCHHNYCEQENHFGRNVWVTRKGAVRAREDDLGIIPGSMGTKSYIVKGKGNPHSYCSCSHGAGRRMSRTEAVKRFTVEDLVQQTHGVECPKTKEVLDEIPAAYKDIDQVMLDQSDLVEVVHTLKAVLNVKGY